MYRLNKDVNDKKYNQTIYGDIKAKKYLKSCLNKTTCRLVKFCFLLFFFFFIKFYQSCLVALVASFIYLNYKMNLILVFDRFSFGFEVKYLIEFACLFIHNINFINNFFII